MFLRTGKMPGIYPVKKAKEQIKSLLARSENRTISKVKGKSSLHTSQVTHQASAYLQHEATMSYYFYPPTPPTPPWMQSYSTTGLPPALNLLVPIYTTWWRVVLWEWIVLPKNMRECSWPGSKPDWSRRKIVTMVSVKNHIDQFSQYSFIVSTSMNGKNQ